MPDIVIYTRQTCFFCIRAKELLEELAAPYREIRVDGDPDALKEMYRLSQRRTVPQIWIGDTHVGGCDELINLHRKGQLKQMLQPADGNLPK